MSTAAKVTLATVSLATIATIFGVHYVQQADKDSMHQGVVRDEERQRQRKEREVELQRQRALESALKETQSVTKT